MLSKRYTVSALAVSSALALVVGGAGLFAWTHVETTEQALEVPPPCHLSAETEADRFPDELRGSYVWDHAREAPQSVVLRVNEKFTRQQHDRKVVVANGRGVYDGYASFDFRIEVDAATNEFKMFESNPNVEAFITAGHHTGRIEPSFDAVVARWHDDMGGTGTLRVSAVAP